jgi:hypothetical protein
MKKRDDQITLRLAGTLRAELEAVASADELSLSGLVRKVLINFATARVVESGNIGARR